MPTKSKPVVVEVGRSAISGRFIPISQAERHPRTTVVQHITKPACAPVRKGK